MTWNYRVILIDDTLGIHEVYYDSEGKPEFYTESPTPIRVFSDEGIDSLKWSINNMSKALDKPILTEQDFKK